MHFDINNHNMGHLDRLIRAALGTILMIGAFVGSSWIAGLIGAVLLGTAYLRFCPVYTFFNFSSNKDVAPASK